MKAWYKYTMEYLYTCKENEDMKIFGKWIEPENILSVVIQIQRNQHYKVNTTTHICDS